MIIINYKKAYLHIFNATSDALTFLNAGQPLDAMRILKNAQLETERMFIEHSDQLAVAFPSAKDNKADVKTKKDEKSHR